MLASGTVKDQQVPDNLDEASDTSSGPNGSTTKVQKTPTGSKGRKTGDPETGDPEKASRDRIGKKKFENLVESCRIL